MRGDLFRLKAPRDGRGHERKGERYAVVLQSADELREIDRALLAVLALD